jgi:hypothetical protein
MRQRCNVVASGRMTASPESEGNPVRHARPGIASFAYFVSDDATDHCTDCRSRRAATRQDGTTQGTDSGTDGSVLFLC